MSKKKKSHIYVGTHVIICKTNPHNFNGCRGVVESTKGPKFMKYGVKLLWDVNNSPVNHYTGFARKHLQIISIRGKKKKHR